MKAQIKAKQMTDQWQKWRASLMAAALMATALFFVMTSAFAAGTYDPPAPSKAKDLHPAYQMAEKFIAKETYPKALEALTLVLKDEPKNADAWNLKGFSHRKIGEYDASYHAYETALALDPKHRQAMEYMGELHLTLGELDKAEALLARLKKACSYNCTYRDMLAKAIADYKAANS